MAMKIDELAKQFIELRDARDKMSKVYEEHKKRITEEMEKIEQGVIAFLNETGQKSARTDYGTFSKKITSSVTVADRQEFMRFVKEKDAFDLLQSRISKTVYDTYAEDGIVVPGVSVYKKLGLSVVRSRK